jgi:hypothetical protein
VRRVRRAIHPRQATRAVPRAPVHRGPADGPEAGLPGQALDVAVREAPDVCPDDQGLEGPGPDDRTGVGDHLRDEAGQAVPDLGHSDRDLALGGLDPAWPGAIAGARGIRRPLVAGPAQEDGHLVLDRPLEDELSTQATEGAEGIGIPETTGEHRLDGCLDLDTRGYSLFHGVVS